MNYFTPNTWSARWLPLRPYYRPLSISIYNGGSASNYVFPLQQNWDGGSASSVSVGKVDGGNV